MGILIIRVPRGLSPRLRQRLHQDLQDHVRAFVSEVRSGTPDDVLDPRPS